MNSKNSFIIRCAEISSLQTTLKQEDTIHVHI